MRKIVFLILICLILSSCTAQTPSNDGKTKVTIVLDWVPNTNHTGLYAANDLGYYSEIGLEVNIIQPPEDGAPLLVASGRADFGISFQEELAFALSADEPLPLTAVAAVLQHNTSGIISLKEKGIKTPKDMEGKRYATWDAPVEKAILKNVIEADGGSFERVKMIPATVTDVAAAIQTNIDAVWVYYGWDGVSLETQGLQTNFFEFKDINPVLDFYTPIIIANSDFLSNNSKAAKAFLDATARGYEFAASNPERAAEILTNSVPEIDFDIALKSQRYLSGKYVSDDGKWGIIDKERWSAFYDWLYDNKLITKKLGESGFTNKYLKGADK